MRLRIPEIPTIFKAVEKKGEVDGEQLQLADGKFKARQAVSFSNSKKRLEVRPDGTSTQSVRQSIYGVSLMFPHGSKDHPNYPKLIWWFHNNTYTITPKSHILAKL